MAWVTPKTNWVGTDRFFASDWARIINNISYIADALGIEYVPLVITDHVSPLVSADCNESVTDMLETLYAALNASFNRGYVAPRVDYGSAWNSRDLNIIEDMLLKMKEQLDGTISGNVDYYSDEIYCGDTISVGLL